MILKGLAGVLRRERYPGPRGRSTAEAHGPGRPRTRAGPAGTIFFRDARTAAGEPVAFLEIARGRAEMTRGDGSLFMLAGGEPIHAGAVIEGFLEIEFRGEVVRYQAGDAILIPPGPEQRHRPKAVSGRVRLALVDWPG